MTTKQNWRSKTDQRIILGIFYGRTSQLNNKPQYVRDRTGDYFHCTLGRPRTE